MSEKHNIAILSVIDEEWDDKAYRGIAEISNDNKRRYATRYGYSLITAGNLAPERNIAWSKIRGLLSMMEVGFEWIFVMDADVIITNPAVRLEALIDERFDLIITTDDNGFNAGNFFVRSGPTMREFFERVWERREFATTSAILESQEAIWNELQRDPPALVKIAPQRAFNAYWMTGGLGNWVLGDFLIHFAGMGGERAGQRLELMRQYAELVDWKE